MANKIQSLKTHKPIPLKHKGDQLKKKITQNLKINVGNKKKGGSGQTLIQTLFNSFKNTNLCQHIDINILHTN